jgi:hypothetical protein
MRKHCALLLEFIVVFVGDNLCPCSFAAKTPRSIVALSFLEIGRPLIQMP